ncbi:RseC/MucC-like positive regulator of sigma(E) [Rhodobacter sp. JA431]|uniref:SoxR reducing system RseC family protein n=1 Tax=Rhodobacter sp. JA431 TaxID=570013 RepID=UPI000BC4B2C4|nr:SoxR reducing system RseC family protein [Rhodobacter sp. JA431]SOB98386.1 RseC/MucC-like positive regulator of sigma(E) [Rhodobacter sp. JA431]
MTGCTPDLAADPAPRALSERLRVVAVGPERVTVLADRAAGCAACASRKGCGTGALAQLSRPQLLEIARPEGLEIRPGDELEVMMGGNDFLAAAGLAYLLPAVTLVVGVSIAAGLGAGDLLSGLVGLGALALGFVPVALMERRGRNVAELQAVAVHPPRVESCHT